MYIMTFRVAHWDKLDDIVLYFNVQGEDVFECTNGKCYVSNVSLGLACRLNLTLFHFGGF